ncbi:mediator of RNA polymerase II transcription subunit 15a-like isoform X2 [Eucalyptus grandis]|uniref:mediator of RNA polymerase II transcription subunit 15a-like isoform X2 n=1 Tax=Eucalyptus grandis TaxID=71139 RepID=UPI00192F0F86|nr:mediator of RNA polymerase II transcription subunit 15a-like isoform X2 [Eucalyptus grandis]
MDDTNRRPPTPPGGVGDGGAEAALEGADWRAQLAPELREGIVDNIMDTLKTHLPVSGPEDLQELKKIAMRFEEKIYTAATSQSDYLGKISPKMLTMETKSQSTLPNALSSNSAGSSSKDLDMLSQIQSQSQPIPNSLAVNQPQVHQQLLVQNVQNNVQSGGQAAASLLSALPSVSGLKQSSLPSTIGQNNNMQNMASFSQNLLANSMGQGLNSNMFVNSERVIQAMQRMASQKQQQQSQNPQQYLYQQQLTKQKLQPGNILHSLVSSRFQQQPQQQNLLQPTKLQAPQQSVLQTSPVMQSHSMQLTPLTGLQQNQQSSVPQSTQSMLQQHQGLWQQQPQQAVHQQQASLLQQPMLTPQQHQQHQLSSQQLMQQNLLVGQQNNLGDMQQQQGLLNQQNNLQNLQQQQLLMLQQNNLTNIHPQQMAPQINVSGLNQHRPLVASQSGNFSMQAGQHPVYGLQQSKVPLQQQIQGGTSNLLASQGQQSQAQPMQQQLMSQIQQQPAQLQQQVGLQQQANILQWVMHQRLQALLVQQQNVIDQLKQLCPSHRSLPETSTTSIDSSAQAGHSTEGDWQEEAYQKLKSMRESYMPELNEMYEKISRKLQQHKSLPQQPKPELLEKLKAFRTMLERVIAILQFNRADIVPLVPSFKEKLVHYEKQIINLINTSRSRKVAMQQGQPPPSHMHSS